MAKQFLEWKNIRCTIALTEACNLQCRHCYINAGHRTKDPELTVQEIFAIATELTRQQGKEGVEVFLTGGEPFIRKDILDVLHALSDAGAKLALTTNGLLISSRIIESLVKYRVKTAVSLDGAIKEHHEYIRGPRTFRRTVAVIKEMVSEGIPVVIDSVVCQENCSGIRSLFELAVQLDVDELVLTNIVMIGRAQANKDTLHPVRLDELCGLIEEICQEDVRFEKIGINNLEALVPHRRKWVNCGAGREMIYVSSDGSVYPCSNLSRPEFQAGNIRDQKLKDIWEDSPILGRIRIINPSVSHPACSTCEFSDRCHGGCLAEKGEHFDLTHPQCSSFKNMFKSRASNGSERRKKACGRFV